ncbi:hypothetical protein DKM44_05820 [Deinococcus irradiatisoli]|uniref:Uncharacterized protein n=2 Tax=Deinococcus irradiatisoli TaxID=2202254 RepID=A0A2Z3JCN9_9DEIO|nr:hypothetical protein DKM44_05820 [Deinococcus irradiatisoli]
MRLPAAVGVMNLLAEFLEANTAQDTAERTYRAYPDLKNNQAMTVAIRRRMAASIALTSIDPAYLQDLAAALSAPQPAPDALREALEAVLDNDGSGGKFDAGNLSYAYPAARAILGGDIAGGMRVLKAL